MRIKLKPCPFCDNSVNFYMKALERYDKMGELAEHYCLICENCETHGPVADSKIRAEVAWNKLPREKATSPFQPVKLFPLDANITDIDFAPIKWVSIKDIKEDK